jgi:hypothetical protein
MWLQLMEKAPTIIGGYREDLQTGQAIEQVTVIGIMRFRRLCLAEDDDVGSCLSSRLKQPIIVADLAYDIDLLLRGENGVDNVEEHLWHRGDQDPDRRHSLYPFGSPHGGSAVVPSVAVLKPAANEQAGVKRAQTMALCQHDNKSRI